MTATSAPSLRPYQSDAIERLSARRDDRTILVLPTGAGKTHLATEIIREHLETTPTRALFVAPRREIIGQARERFERSGLHTGQLLGGSSFELDAPLLVCSPETLNRRRPQENIGLVIIDEAHHGPGRARRILETYQEARIIGMTATPSRLDGRGLGEFGWTHLEIGADGAQLVDEDYLVLPRIFTHPAAVDTKGIRHLDTAKGRAEVADRAMGAQLVGDIVRHWKTRAEGLRTVLFAVNIAHSMRLIEAFNNAGIPAEHIDGNSTAHARDGALDRLRRGETLVVGNCELIGMGMDMPVLECAILARPTRSLALYRQQVGRIMRKPGPTILLDHAGNYARLGSPIEPVTWTLEGRAKRESIPMASKGCPMCFRQVPPGMEICPECGHVFEVEKREVQHIDGELVEVDAHLSKSYAERRDFWRRSCKTLGVHTAETLYRRRFKMAPDVILGTKILVDTLTHNAKYRAEVFDWMLRWFAESLDHCPTAQREHVRLFRKEPAKLMRYQRRRGA